MALQMTFSGSPRLRIPADSGQGWQTVYGVGAAFQLSPDCAATVVNRRIHGVSAVDLEDGGDLLVFDALEGLDASRAIPLGRSEYALHPRSGRKVCMVSYLNIGGFVPLGARLVDGSTHPAAGTGFALSTHIGYPLDAETGAPDRPQGAAHVYQQIVQLRFDGTTVQVTDRYQFEGSGLLPGYEILNRGLTPAIPDGPDLLSGIVAGPMVRGNREGDCCIPTSHPAGHKRLGRNYGSACCRWQYRQGAWRPSEIVPVSGPDMAAEPSLVRDLDGALLMAVRGGGLKDPPGEVHEGLENTMCHFRVYRSSDGGATWQSILHKPLMRSATPVSLNVTAGGRPFLAANPYVAERDGSGRKIWCSRWRHKLCLWPLTPDRRDVETQRCVLDADDMFGSPRQVENKFMLKANMWMVDHPIATVCRLGDGHWHCLQSFRVSDKGVNTAGAAPTEHNGMWLERITAKGEQERPAWNF